MNKTSAQPNPQPVFAVKADGEGFTVYRDAGPLQTPRTMPVTVPRKELAEAIAEECAGQGERLDLRKMPLTQMALTAIDISSHHRGEVIDGIMKFGDNELLCLRASEPADLVAAQDAGWKPYLDWCNTTFGITLETATGLTPPPQKPQDLSILRRYVEEFDAFRLTAVSEAVGISGSLVLGLALSSAHADGAAIADASELDSLWQAKKWGEDPATQSRHEEITRELQLCARWLALLN